MPTNLTPRDLDRLEGVHLDLQRLVFLMADYCPMTFMVDCGVRTVEQQAEYVASGASQTMDSRHLHGFAVDLLILNNGVIPWDDWPQWQAFSVHMKGAADLTGTPIAWGGDWTTLVDGPHWELPKAQYPNPTTPPPEAPEEPVVA